MRVGLLLCAQLLAALVFVVLSRAESGRPQGTRDVACALSRPLRKLTIVFVDSLSDRVAKDPEVMPELTHLAGQGVSLSVTPCRDQLTYLCLRAVLTGYDESSLLAVRGNFRHEASVGDNLLYGLARAGRKVVVVGSHDFEPYQTALFRTKFGDGSGESETRAISDLRALDPDRSADVTLISLSNGDRTAHVFGTHSPRYREAFRAIDGIIAEAVAHAGPDSDVLVFGDHGHDEMGRHLPGLPSTTSAVYAGPSFRKQGLVHATLSDHRAILGVLLGVPSPPSYTGPALDQIFAFGLLGPEQRACVSALRAPPARKGSSVVRFVLALATLVSAMWIAQRVLVLTGLERFARWAIAALGASLMALAGHGYDALR